MKCGLFQAISGLVFGFCFPRSSSVIFLKTWQSWEELREVLIYLKTNKQMAKLDRSLKKHMKVLYFFRNGTNIFDLQEILWTWIYCPKSWKNAEFLKFYAIEVNFPKKVPVIFAFFSKMFHVYEIFGHLNSIFLTRFKKEPRNRFSQI